MSSVIFQPLLHDPLGWKASNSTYTDAFKWKMERPSNKEKKISPYGQQYQRQMRKQRKLQEKNASLPSVASSIVSEEQTIEPLVLVKDHRSATSTSHRSSLSKTPPIVSDEPQTIQRPASINREATCVSRISHHSSVAVEETDNPSASLDVRPSSSKEEKENAIIDLNNDQTRHWLTYPNPKTPQYIIDIKQRLGQLKVPSAPIRSLTVVNETTNERAASSASHHLQKSGDHRHMFDFNLPQTPDELRASRHRLDKHRYNPALDNYPTRPKTCPVRSQETSKPPTSPNNASQSQEEELPPTETSQLSPPENNDLPTEETKPGEHETSTSSIQMIDTDGLPNEYCEAVQTANVAQEEYVKAIKNNQEKRANNFVYHFTSMPFETQSESAIAYHQQQQQSNASTNQNTTRSGDFGNWVRNATENERRSAMKILREVLRQPIVGYDIPIKQTITPRSHSAPRKLGRTRTPHKRTACEICEKQMIKHHVWNLSRSDTLTCPHQAQGIKPPIIQIRA